MIGSRDPELVRTVLADIRDGARIELGPDAVEELAAWAEVPPAQAALMLQGQPMHITDTLPDELRETLGLKVADVRAASRVLAHQGRTLREMAAAALSDWYDGAPSLKAMAQPWLTRQAESVSLPHEVHQAFAGAFRDANQILRWVTEPTEYEDALPRVLAGLLWLQYHLPVGP